jgi:murein DD-endopeptidase MepM/ murein hydrolase activator NlpD
MSSSPGFSYRYKHFSLCFTVAFFLGAFTIYIADLSSFSFGNAEKMESRLQYYSDLLENQNKDNQVYANSLELKLLKIKNISREIAANNNLNFEKLESLPIGGDFIQPNLDNQPTHRSLLTRYSSLEQEISQELLFLSAIKKLENVDFEQIISGFPIESGHISSPFGIRLDPINHEWSDHNGLDIAAPTGTKIHSTAAGIVTYAGEQGAFGNLIEVQHTNGFITRYAHCDQILVSLNDHVTKNQLIATVGSTGRSLGSHLHYEVLLSGQALDPDYFVHR